VDLVTYWHGGITCAYHYETRIASLALPGVKNTPQSTKKHVEDGTISIIVIKFVIGEEGRRHPPQQDSRPFPKAHPNTTSISYCVSSARAARIVHRALCQKYQQFCVNHTQSFGRPQQLLLAA
jgi:hypothetical protein